MNLLEALTSCDPAWTEYTTRAPLGPPVPLLFRCPLIGQITTWFTWTAWSHPQEYKLLCLPGAFPLWMAWTTVSGTM